MELLDLNARELNLVTTTKLNLNSPNTIINPKHPLYLFKITYNEYTMNLDPITMIQFFGTLDDSALKLVLEQRQMEKKFDGKIYDRKVYIVERKKPQKIVFKIRFNSAGCDYIIQIQSTSEFIIYYDCNIKPLKRTQPACLYGNEIQKSNLSQNSFHIVNNKFLSFFSRMFNRPGNLHASKLAASLFYSVSPKKPKLQRQEILKQINPDNTLEGVFDKLGGKLCIY